MFDIVVLSLVYGVIFSVIAYLMLQAAWSWGIRLRMRRQALDELRIGRERMGA